VDELNVNHPCPTRDNPAPLKEPFHLIDEDGHRYELRFDRTACEMEVFF